MPSNSYALSYLAQQGRNRFIERKNVNMTEQQLKREIAVLTGFLESKMSTVQGQKQIAKSTKNTFKEKYNIDLDNAEMEYFLYHFDEFRDALGYGSDSVVKLMGEVSGDITNADQIKKLIRSMRRSKDMKHKAQNIYKNLYKGTNAKPNKDKKKIIAGLIETLTD